MSDESKIEAYSLGRPRLPFYWLAFCLVLLAGVGLFSLFRSLTPPIDLRGLLVAASQLVIGSLGAFLILFLILLHRRPYATLDREGIHLRLPKPHTIPWSAVECGHVDSILGTTYLRLQLEDDARHPNAPSLFRLLAPRAWRAMGGGSLVMDLTGTGKSKEELFELIQRYRGEVGE